MYSFWQAVEVRFTFDQSFASLCCLVSTAVGSLEQSNFNLLSSHRNGVSSRIRERLWSHSHPTLPHHHQAVLWNYFLSGWAVMSLISPCLFSKPELLISRLEVGLRLLINISSHVSGHNLLSFSSHLVLSGLDWSWAFEISRVSSRLNS